ncbi:leucine-rich repeat extensin-like protein 2 [Phoenix dactylifera]|uniref:Leucine-rich repeat extensin-like protein 2 n=1 Tax=Phoenix dactylifera TaxID=42345 RepID=A0A8B9AH56_PHODC|nr:leucine-rich repeat extensin-like protein 2 [Phoenix dactylifera]
MDAVPTAAGGGAGGVGYADSVDSSPRSRGGESWDEPFPTSAAAAASRLRLMCSYGGRIVPRPTDKSLCYLGGETRIVVVDRQSSLADLSAKLSRSVLGGLPFSLKYQLPNEDLDSLISVTTDEDLENMIEEYDRIIQSSSAGAGGGSNNGSTRSNRLRLFLFPSKPESAPSSMGSILDDSKSESWFVDALNSAMGIGIDGLPRGLSADSASVNCLLGLEDDSSTHSRGVIVGGAGPGAAAASEAEQLILPRPDSSGKLARHGQDVHSVPDSPMLDTTSSFGSTSSAPSLSNLPPIRVRPEDRPPDQRIGGLEDHFAYMNLSSAATAAVIAGQRPDEGYKDPNFPPHYPPPPSNPPPTASASTPTISPSENSSRVFSDDEKSDHGGVRKPPPAPQPKPTPIEAPISDSTTRPMYYQERASPAAAVNPASEPKREVPASVDPSYRVPMQVPDSGYMLPPMPPEQLQQQHRHHQQPQFISANPQYIHHPVTGAVVPVHSYYHQIQQSQQPHPYDHQIPMYYLPVPQNPQAYNLSAVPPNMPDPSAAKPSVPLLRTPVKPAELPSNLYRTAATSAPPPAALQPPLIHLAADQVPHQYAGMGYHVMHHHPSQAPAAMANYGYEYVDPAHAQMYYSQAGSPPALAPQYQAVSSAAGIPDSLPGDGKQARAS